MGHRGGQEWAVLVRPSANRVYAAAAPALLEAELAVLDESVLGGRLDDVGTETLGDVPYVTFRGDLDGDEQGLLGLGMLSTRYAVFRRAGSMGPAGSSGSAGEEALHPVTVGDPAHLDDDLVTIPKYAGKTNELFTRLLLNVTLWAAGVVPGRLGAAPPHPQRVRVLDPMCGRGTTLHEALRLGCDADGLDLDGRALEAHEAHLKTWLRHQRLKHTAEVTPVRRDGRRVGRRLDVSLAAHKQAWKAGDVQRLRAVEGDTTRAVEHFRAGTYDVVATDAPYGVRHGSRTTGGLDRSPRSLLAESVGGWARLLRPGGALGLAWNTLGTPRAEVADLLRGAGLEPLDHGPWRGLAHRVDSSVHRDVVVARRPTDPTDLAPPRPAPNLHG